MTTFFKINVVLIILFLSIPSSKGAESTPSTNLSDTWEGYISAPERKLPIKVNLLLSAEESKGDLVLVFEGNTKIPFDTIELSSDALLLEALDGQMSFTLEIEDVVGDKIPGTATNRGAEFPVVLARTGSEALNSLNQEFADSQSARAKFLKTSSGAGAESVHRDALRKLIEEADRTNTTSLVIFANNELVGEWHRNGEPSIIESMSVTKAILNLVVGRLVTLKQIDIDTAVGTFFPNQLDWQTAPKDQITIRHLLTHTSGIDPGVPTHELYASEDFVAFALNAPLEDQPGTAISYNNTAANLLAAVANKATDELFDRFVEKELFSKLGIDNATWLDEPAGNPQGMAGLQISALDLAKLGLLASNNGRWKGERIISDEWFETSFQPQNSDLPKVGILESNPADIGFLWFINKGEKKAEQRKTIFHTGYLGQYLIIQPEAGLVAVRMIKQNDIRESKADMFRSFPDLVNEL